MSSATVSRCLVSGKALEPIMSFGRMPIANGFLTPQEFANEYFYELKIGVDLESSLVQLTELVDPNKMFHDHYAFFSSTSMRMKEHFRGLAESIQSSYLQGVTDPLVIEIGSNDGICLENFAKKGIRHLGIEPSSNVAHVAEAKGIRTICRFFNEELAHEILSKEGPVYAFCGANVMCHIPAINSVFKGVKALLKPKGIFLFEDPYLGDILKKTSYDQIYDEHVFYFSATSVSWIGQKHGLELVDVLPQEVHGGSMRYVLSHAGARPVSAQVIQRLKEEKAQGLDRMETYLAFKKKVEASRDKLVGLLKDLRAKNQRVIGYGATSKSTTVTNFCGIGPELVEYISDTTPIKQGKYSPGTHIPVKPYEVFVKDDIQHSLLFAWNHSAEILTKETAFTRRGGKFIVYVPEVRFL